jgi:hypothetical protein
LTPGARELSLSARDGTPQKRDERVITALW